MNFNRYKYYSALIDYIAAFFALLLFSYYLKSVHATFLFIKDGSDLWNWRTFPLVISIPMLWLLLYKSSGHYDQPLRKFNFEVIWMCFLQTFIGVSLLFLINIFCLFTATYNTYFQQFIVLFLLQFLLIIISRYLYSIYVNRLKMTGKIFFNVLFVGRIQLILPMLNELNNHFSKHGNRFLGYVSVDEVLATNSYANLECIGSMNNLPKIVHENGIDDVIVLLNENDQDIYKKVLHLLSVSNVNLKINVELYPMLMGRPDVTSLFQFPLIQISRDIISPAKLTIKRMVDIIASIMGLIITLPVIVLLIIIIKFSSKGSFIYSQERVGLNERPFKIYKFRSMFENSEVDGPMLATKNDNRITRIGSFMRRLRLDEIPNFINVLIGDMSLVGPRPERKFYIDQIVERAPEYRRLLLVKPGVTSWGQVKYGYAENIDEMIKRMHYDLLYIENMSLYIDLQILFKTVFTILQGRGI